MSDFEFADHGSICLLVPISPDANDWVSEHIPDDAMRWGACAIVIEPRYVDDVLAGILDEGLTIHV
jgi:hypothetical protein